MISNEELFSLQPFFDKSIVRLQTGSNELSVDSGCDTGYDRANEEWGLFRDLCEDDSDHQRSHRGTLYSFDNPLSTHCERGEICKRQKDVPQPNASSKGNQLVASSLPRVHSPTSSCRIVR